MIVSLSILHVPIHNLEIMIWIRVKDEYIYISIENKPIFSYQTKYYITNFF